jgi:hypothetical protein
MGVVKYYSLLIHEDHLSHVVNIRARNKMPGMIHKIVIQSHHRSGPSGHSVETNGGATQSGKSIPSVVERQSGRFARFGLQKSGNG